MKIALVGYGKMGHAIEQLALKRGHEVPLKIATANRHELNDANLKEIDVVIEFTNPEAAQENVLECLKAGVPVVCGTTGWNERLSLAKMTALQHNTSFLHASNFSVGVNIFFEVNKFLASMMNDQDSYDIVLEETHHTQKKDAPSGTAITLAEQILENVSRKRHWTKEATTDSDAFPIISHRIENVPGTHSVTYTSAIDDIEIIHTAHNREGFAKGAVLAAEYIAGKKGVFTMKDVLGLNKL
ncbi:MAG TPA: 4-hydroxy-tetrahydrodipicolinate reductase [Flavipsychrobacter sp.]|nr:4-hydroxy-tetrahydrodipicolinate reductase [Flavipsychrobacter sp.]